MKSIVLIVLGVLLGVAIMLFVPHGAPQIVYAGSPSGNGDVNGDGRIDIADAVYLLTHLFADGPAPEAIQGGTGGLPATGQTECYDANGAKIPCTRPDFPGQDGFYQKGCPMAGRFVDNGDGTVTDNCTGLMWQKNTTDCNGDGVMSAQDQVTWQSALLYCEGLEFARHSDWRLPNLRELQSIVNNGLVNPSIGFPFSAIADYHWSSTTNRNSNVSAWCVRFNNGIDYSIDKDGTEYVRAVRDAR